jgi:ABC-type branched-subunit amino acid transport system ATPase component
MQMNEPDALLRATRRVGPVILDLKNISLSFGGVKALTDISFDVRQHEIRAIIGPNGAGKSSMLNVINGVYRPQQGAIIHKGQQRKGMDCYAAAKSGIARTFQNIALFKGMTVLDNIMTGRNLKMKSNFLMQARRSSTATRPRRSSTSSKSRPSATRRWAACPTACKSAWSLAGRWPPNRRSCCWTNRWRA